MLLPWAHAASALGACLEQDLSARDMEGIFDWSQNLSARVVVPVFDAPLHPTVHRVTGFQDLGFRL